MSFQHPVVSLFYHAVFPEHVRFTASIFSDVTSKLSLYEIEYVEGLGVESVPVKRGLSKSVFVL